MILVIVLGWSLCGCLPQSPNVIQVGGIFDLTGATSDVGIPYADGVRDCVKYLNEQGGINGREIKLIDADYGYNIERAKTLYTRLVKEDHVLAIMGWGTGDTEALRPYTAADKIPFMSASYAESLTIVQEAPYNFLIGVTYSDQMRIALQYIRDSWTDTSRAPRVALIYNDTGFGLAPIQDGRDYAAAHGIEIIDEQIVSLSTTDATEQLRNMAAQNPDYAIVQETTAAGSVIARDAQTLAIPTRLVFLNWSADEKFITLGGEAAEGALGTVPFAFITEDAPGLAEIKAFNQAKGVDPTTRSIRYVQGWTTMKVMAEGIRRAGDDLTGEGIRRGLESLTNLGTGDITAPITFNPNSHKGATALRIYQVQNGRWVPITDYIQAQP
ncbi:MAG: ABC transporter substrate-binding protein [Chloroflexi bacterium]|nr:ABC transporter substrate-binding protein [Chloroflexota bacterium]MBU1751396.1 ABC transporter substrate-binding protein [Chloroflexota bacterium]MBU1878055.1 ABC transporter substrate-binding protein [Chloroflexota bacterium]